MSYLRNVYKKICHGIAYDLGFDLLKMRKNLL